MDFQYLMRILKGRKWLIASVSLAAAFLAYYMVGKKPPVYKADVVVSTGIVNYKGINSDGKDGFVQEYQVENSFSNLTEFCQSRSSIKLLTIKLLQHDLMLAGGSLKEPFRQPNKALSNFTDAEMAELRDDLRQLKLDSIIDPALEPRTDFLLDKISRAYGYDHDQLRNSLEIKRIGETDYLRVSFKSDNAKLTHYAANNYVQEFMNYYQNLRLQKNRADVDFYTKLTAEKRVVIDSLKNRLDAYKFERALPRLDEGGKALYSQMTELELQYSDATKRAQSSIESKRKIEGYLNEGDRRLVNERMDRVISKSESMKLAQKMTELQDASIRAGKKDPKIEKELKEAKEAYTAMLASEARGLDRSIDDEKTNRADDLFKKKVEADLEATEADNAVKTISAKLGVLRQKLTTLVHDDAFTNGINTDLTRAEDEYTKLNNNLNDARLAYESSRNPLHVIENAQFPEWPQSNQRKLITVFSGIAAGTLATMAIFLFAFFDSSFQSPFLFKKMVEKLPMLGAVNTVELRKLDLRALFAVAATTGAGHEVFRESLRRIRMLLEGSGSRVFLVTSTKPGEGKSFIINSLAHALAANNRSVLIIDTQFRNPTLSKFAGEATRFAPIVNRLLLEHDLGETFHSKQNATQFQLQNVDVLGNKQPSRSPAEVFSGKNFRRMLEELSGAYDFVLMEAPALNKYADARELSVFADKVIGVFSADSGVQQADRDSIEFLEKLGDMYLGSVLNQVDLKNMN